MARWLNGQGPFLSALPLSFRLTKFLDSLKNEIYFENQTGNWMAGCDGVEIIVKKFLLASIVAVAPTIFGATAQAGPFILSGTDADDHGSSNSSGNLNGWLYMQRALENLAPALMNGHKTVVALGSNPGTEAGNAAQSAFNFSNLAPTFSFSFVNGVAAINAFFAPGGGASTTGIIMMDSTSSEVGGGATSAEVAAFTANAAAINNFLGAGGGLFAQQGSFNGFLSVLLPSVTVSSESSTGISLTLAGKAAFPNLTNADLSAGPYHERFNNTGIVPVLGTGTNSGSPIIIGARTGTISQPGTPVPEPTAFAVLAIGLLGLSLARRSVS